MTAYYNENDPKAAAWLRELIKAGHIAPGDVDDRSIWDVTPADVAGYTQCHFFAGIGGWSYALRLAGWSDSREVWTGSCPCQPFSAAGKRSGFDDERHLWPSWFWLISQCRPRTIFGEQVASSLPWLDLVCSDLEAENYASWAVSIGAHSVGAPHIRQRLYFVADRDGERLSQRPEPHRQSELLDPRQGASLGSDAVRRSGLADSDSGNRGRRSTQSAESFGANAVGAEEPRRRGSDARLGDASSTGSGRNGGTVPRSEESQRNVWGLADCTFLTGPDGKRRPIKPGLEPLVDGLPGRVGLLRGYGNAIVPQAAAAFIAAYVDARGQDL